MKKTLLLLCLLLTSILAMAYDAEIDGIYYNLSGVNATVTYKTESCNSYSGNVVIPSTVTYKGITYSVTSIGEEAFYCCTGLTSVTIPNSVTSIGDDAFDYCTGLSSITIPNSVASIGNYAFEDCSGLTSVTIPESVTSIGSGAFDGCEGLTSITIPNSVTSIGEGVFCWCPSLTSIIVESGNTMYDSRDNCNAIIETATNTLIAGCQNTIIPNSVTSIGNYAFAHCTSLTSVTIGNSVTRIGEDAFDGCTGLTSVAIPNSVTSIGESAFWGCSGLTSITIPNSVTSIGEDAFEDCTGLTSVTVAWETPIELTNSDTFSNANNATLYVPKGTKEAYKAAPYWQDFKEIIEIDMTGIESMHNSQFIMHNDEDIYDLSGRKLCANSQFTIHNSQLKRGIYVIRQSDGTTKRVLVK